MKWLVQHQYLFAFGAVFSVFSLFFFVNGDPAWLGNLGFLGFLGFLAARPASKAT